MRSSTPPLLRHTFINSPMMGNWENPRFTTTVRSMLVILVTTLTSSVRAQDATLAVILKLTKSQLIGLSKSGPILPSISKLIEHYHFFNLNLETRLQNRQSFCKMLHGHRFPQKMVISIMWISETIWKSRIIRKKRLTASGWRSMTVLGSAILTHSRY
jgi:hypothetical protein